MGRRKTPGLTKRNGTWHIDKVIHGRRLCESTGTGNLKDAEDYLAHLTDELRQATLYGVRPRRTFRQAATKYLLEETKKSLGRDAQDIDKLDGFIGDMYLDQIHQGTLQGFIESNRRDGLKGATVNRAIAVVRRILNLAARYWRDENGLSWLGTSPLLRFVDWGDTRKPYPLSWDEQKLLFRHLPAHLLPMAQFKVNTGLREQEVCGLRWEWEEALPTLGISIFVIPGSHTKNSDDRVVVLNRVAREVIEVQRGKDDDWVFPHRGNRLTKLYNSGWKTARERAAARYLDDIGAPCPAGFTSVRVHDLKHTFGRRLRAAGVTLETRKALLGHRSGDITTHYSAAELNELLTAAEKACVGPTSKHQLVLIKGTLRNGSPANLPQGRAG